MWKGPFHRALMAWALVFGFVFICSGHAYSETAASADFGIDKIVPGIIGAILGSICTYFANRQIQKRKLKDDVKLKNASDLLLFLGKTTNREAVDALKGNVPEIRQEWAQHVRTLYLIRIQQNIRRAVDEKMTAYLDVLEEYNTRQGRRTEVERRRDLVIEEARTLVQAMGLA
jgi:hypothetical protein